LLDSSLTFSVRAEIDSIEKEWVLNVTTLTNFEQLGSDFVIYPNPISDFFYVSDYESVDYYYVFDNSGKLLSKVYPTQTEQKFSHLPRGIYFLTFKIKKGYFINKKIVKQ